MKHLITEHLPIWTSAPNGIKKLRELILELAVRGLLVPQDPNDEPASELVKRIAEEKARLIYEGKIKPSKPLPKISEGEKPFELPMGWEFARLDDLSQIITKGSSPKWQGVSYTDNVNDVLFITSENVGSFSLKLESKKYVALKFNEIEPRSILKNGDFLMNIVGGSIGRTAIYDIETLANINQAVCLIRCFPKLLNSRFLLNFFNSQICISYMFDKQVDNARANLSMGNISKFLIPLPPEQEQHRIVAKVDELMQLCDQLEDKQNDNQQTHRQLVSTLLSTLTEASDAQAFQAAWSQIAASFDCLFTTESSIEQLKQTILQLAVMGKLVPQDPNDEPASELLQKIATEKARLLAEGKIKKPKLFPKIGEQEKPFDLPKSWEWVRVSELVKVIDAGWSPACIASASPSSDVWGVLKTTSVQVMEYLEDKNKELPQKLEPKIQYEVKVGDILITRAGPENRVGIACSVQKTRPKLMISDKIIRFSLVMAGISEQFISLCLNTGATAEFLKRVKSGMAASQMNISQDNLLFAPIPLPPLPQQHRIVAKVDELMSLCDQLKTKLATAQSLQQQLAETLVLQAVA